MICYHQICLTIAAALFAVVNTPALAQDRPSAYHLEAARARLEKAWCLRVPHLCVKSNPYAVGANPLNRLDVQVLSWDEMAKGAPMVAEPLKRIIIEGRGIRVVGE